MIMTSAELKEVLELAKEQDWREQNYLISYAMSEHASVNGRKRSVNGRKRKVNVSVNGRKRSANGRKRNVNITENEKRLKVMLCNERLTDATR